MSTRIWTIVLCDDGLHLSPTRSHLSTFLATFVCVECNVTDVCLHNYIVFVHFCVIVCGVCVCVCGREAGLANLSSCFHFSQHPSLRRHQYSASTNPGSHRVLGDTSWSQQDELQLNAVNCLQLSAVIWGSSGYFCGKIQALSEGSDCILLDGLDEHQHHNHGDTMMSFIVGFAIGFSAKTRGWPRAGAA